MKSMQSSPRKTVNVSAGKPRTKTARDPHPQHHTPKRQSDEEKFQKGVIREKNHITRLLKQGKKPNRSGRSPEQIQQALNAIAKKMRSK